MIAEYLNRGVVLDELQKTRQEIERQLASVEPQDDDDAEKFLLEQLLEAERRERQGSSGQRGFEPKTVERRGHAPAPLDDFAFVSRDPIICLLQSALDQFAEERPDEVVETPPSDATRRGPNRDVMVSSRRLRAAPEPLRANDGRRIFNKFSITDAGWVRSKLAEGVSSFRGKHEFNDRPARPVELPSRSRLVLVGDWGSGLPRAQKVAKQMRAVLEERRISRRYRSNWCIDRRPRSEGAGSFLTRRWSERDSNFQSPAHGQATPSSRGLEARLRRPVSDNPAYRSTIVGPQ